MGNQSSNGFGSSSTAEDVVRGLSLKGKTVVITGANTGIGKETARALASIGAEVYIAGRDEQKTNKAIEDIKKSTGNDKVHYLPCDLSSLESIKECANKFIAENKPLHILINNAGIFGTPHRQTKDGFELQFGTNHLGHFYFTALLLDRLKESAPSRVVCLSSDLHKMGKVDFNNLNSEKSYSSMGAYNNSKLCNILFANEFNLRYAEKDGVYANSLHPGVIRTDLLRDHGMMKMIQGVGRFLMKSIEQGASTTCYVATSPELERVGGKYFEDCHESKPTKEASDPDSAKRLWEVSEKLVGLA